MYSEFDLAAQPKVAGTVVRGFITRFSKEESWAATLVALPPGVVAEDADAVRHYVKGVDGRYHEYYGHAPSSIERPIYVDAAEFLD